MQINSLTADFAVADQITPDDVARLKQDGYTALICNRPDEEVSGHEDSAAIEAAARAAGLTFCYNPVVNGALNAENVRLQGEAIEQSTGPVLAYCRSGMRSSVVWALSQAGKTPADDLIAAAARAGYDISGLRRQIESAAR
jgi:uncharacterized protein (TIGR01244 family)